MVSEDATLHLVQRLQGSGSSQELAVAAGGKIKQSVIPDSFSKDTWDSNATVTLNVQILNALTFYSVTGISAPETPASAATYQKQGLPFFKMYEETSSVNGMFSGVDTVSESSCSCPLKSVDGTPLKKENGKDDNESDIAILLVRLDHCPHTLN